MFAEFISTYGTEILYTVLSTVITAIAGYIGIALKKLYTEKVNDKTKKEIVKTVVMGIEQIYKELHGEEKLNKAIESVSEMLCEKGITVTDFELRMLIESAVGEFNNAFNKTE